MRNYELIQKIWSVLHISQARPATKVLTIENLLKRERPELAKDKDNFWYGGYLEKKED